MLLSSLTAVSARLSDSNSKQTSIVNTNLPELEDVPKIVIIKRYSVKYLKEHCKKGVYILRLIST